MHLVLTEIFLGGFLQKPEKKTNYSAFLEEPDPPNGIFFFLLVERGIQYVLQQWHKKEQENWILKTSLFALDCPSSIRLTLNKEEIDIGLVNKFLKLET